MIKVLRRAGLAVVFLWFFLGGVTHFTNTPFFVAIVPPWVPFPLAAVYVSGICEIVLALAIWLPAWRATCGVLLMLLTVAVTPANVHMWLHPEQFPGFNETALTARLVFQGVLLVLIWWSSRPDVTPPAPRGGHPRGGHPPGGDPRGGHPPEAGAARRPVAGGD